MKRLPLVFATALAGLSLLPVVTNPTLEWTLIGTAVALASWQCFLEIRHSVLTVSIVLRPQHYVQACAQGAVLLYWGWYWREVYDSAHLLLAQLLFAYAFDMLLSWSRRHTYALGFSPVPVIFSINLFLWFKPDWFYLQFLLIGLGFAAKEFLRWQKDGRQVHIFNPSSFPLGLFSLGLIITGTTSLTWGQEIANTLNYAPQIYLVIFLVSLPGQFLFGVTTMTMSAVATMYGFGLLYFALAETYYFYDAYIPIAVFLGMHLLFTDPSTAPRSELGRVIFGAMYALSVIVLYGVLETLSLPRFYDKWLAVPVINLLIQVIDRLVQTKPMRQIDPTVLLSKTVGKSRNLAYIGLWTIIFLLMNTVQGVGDTHRGHWVMFWKHACADDRPNACRHFGVMVSTYCNRGSGWACNEYGMLLQPERRPQLAASAFDRACELGFSAGCINRDPQPGVSPVSMQPTLVDYDIVLRQGKGPLPVLSSLQIYQRACEQGFSDACQEACDLGDRRACDIVEHHDQR